ncbi:M23 family metallopeptidase [Arthrobacter sp. VKM Ac-2550]|uniref:M23 family metallopeptidase n=1 Tax=Crystallibacter permensis TaxID=1938888 RepID=UPI0022267DDA|nr:M23 family metallopeptidase [Arthrobacter sp. VKM Ac-2550]MCW2135065.1 Murein DD-endopeptidase MepM and murein hydrolase activator NlpD, containing LysM domain [Arthrobacter sp. VKM Ac-2550]
MHTNKPARGRRRATDTSLPTAVRNHDSEGRRASKRRFSATASQKAGLALAATGIIALAAVPTAQAVSGNEDLNAASAASISSAPVTAAQDSEMKFERIEVTSKAAPEQKGEPKTEVKAASVEKAEPKKESKPAPKKTAASGLASPVADLNQSSGFGYRINPVTGAAGEFHNGSDYALACGTDVKAAAAGKIVEASSSAAGYGNRIVIEHSNGMKTTYNHLQSIDVSQGERVSAGASIADLGTTGNSTGCHLHFEVVVDGAEVDPAKYL